MANRTAIEQNNPQEQQAQETLVQNAQQNIVMQQISTTAQPKSVVENYQEIKAALTGTAVPWVLPDLNTRAAATEPAILLQKK